jgi:subtilisin family serine protease
MNPPVRIAILDSGVCSTHPHVGRVVDGISVTATGTIPGYEDRLGHGTAVAAIIHHLNPDADLIAVRIFDGKLATSLRAVMRAIDWCLQHNIQIINLSLGTTNAEYLGAFTAAVEQAEAAGAAIVSALEMNGEPALPGSLPRVIGVIEGEDYASCQRYGKAVYMAPPYPRDIPGVPRERNLRGVSFSVARVSARVAEEWFNWDDKVETKLGPLPRYDVAVVKEI